MAEEYRKPNKRIIMDVCLAGFMKNPTKIKCKIIICGCEKNNDI